MLQKVFNINLLNLQHGINDHQVFDLLLYLFPKYLNKALEQGIFKEYQHKEYNDANVRGTIDISRHLKLNTPFNGRVAYRTREFSYDNHITELVRHTIEYIQATKIGNVMLSYDETTRANVTQIIQATPAYRKQERESVIKENIKPLHHPYYSNYFALQKLCLRILRHEKLKYGNNSNKIHGVLFDVAYLWEEYLNTLLSSKGFEHPQNKKRKGRLVLTQTQKYHRYPDFFKKNDGIVIDAKYKKDIDTRDDVNQMITYMYRLRGKHGIFILPTNQKSNSESDYLLGHGEDIDAQLHIHFVPIPQEVSNYRSFVS